MEQKQRGAEQSCFKSLTLESQERDPNPTFTTEDVKTALFCFTYDLPSSQVKRDS